MIIANIITTVLYIAEHLLVLVSLVCIHILYSLNKIKQSTIYLQRQKIKDVVAEILDLERKCNDR